MFTGHGKFFTGSAMSTVQLRCGYWPADLNLGTVAWETQHHQTPAGPLQLLLPRLTPEQIHSCARYLKTEAQHLFAHSSVWDTVAAVDACIHLMLDEQDPLRQQVELALQRLTGYDAEMLRLGINACLRSFRRPELLRFLSEDFSDPTILDDFRPRIQGGWSKAYGPELLGVIWAGNVPGIPLWSQIAALLTKSPSLGKVATAEPIFASWFAQCLARCAPQLANTLAVLWWPGGDQASEQALSQEADVMMVYGGANTLQAWQNQLPASVRFLAHGHKFSAAFISQAALDTRQAQHCAQYVAQDVSQWDQQACYAPQSIFVERGGLVSPKEFALLVAGELKALSQRYPRQRPSLSTKHAIAQWRQRFSLAWLQGQAVELLGPSHADWAVVYLDQTDQPEASPTQRCVSVIAVDNVAHVAELLRPYRKLLQTVAVATSPEQLFQTATTLSAVGVNRICALGASAQPQPGWHHDGRFSLLDLIRMVDIEASAESLAQNFAWYRD